MRRRYRVVCVPSGCKRWQIDLYERRNPASSDLPAAARLTFPNLFPCTVSTVIRVHSNIATTCANHQTKPHPGARMDA